MRIFRTPFAAVHPHYVTKVEKKGRSAAEVDEVIRWLTGFSQAELDKHLAEETTFEDSFAAAHLNPAVSLITGSVCRVRVLDAEDQQMQHNPYLATLVDRFAIGSATD